ncbi:hypothetical protein GA0061105_10153 [Rhizobium aethiopicum]|uniref:Uncharacterized protein n=1 Tax=Rhizobium aethiopicum TaxID=1138170 RepID=A0A1C3XVH3_9HYPH|nr:hypothetical protein [Rhizobium aethiopicum]SCB56225.1 hypothetical protein GA0061105_10153 [Rhizobium aethiopicum]
MSHNVVAVVGSPAAVSAIVDAAGCPEPTTLPFGLAIAPLGDQQIDRLTELQPGPSHQGFKSLSAALAQAFATASENGQLAYIETAYFGGTGSQAAAAFAEGRMLFSAATPVAQEPVRPSHPINTALRLLGVDATGHADEFDALGLHRFRRLEDLGLEADDD